MKIKNIVIVTIIAIMILASIIGTMFRKNNESDINNNLHYLNVSEVTRSVFYAPQYVAIANGYFEEERIKDKFNNWSRC